MSGIVEQLISSNVPQCAGGGCVCVCNRPFNHREPFLALDGFNNAKGSPMDLTGGSSSVLVFGLISQTYLRCEQIICLISRTELDLNMVGAACILPVFYLYRT